MKYNKNVDVNWLFLSGKIEPIVIDLLGKSASPIVFDCEPRAGKMKRLPEGARRAHLAH